jgi:hypothetical protein
MGLKVARAEAVAAAWPQQRQAAAAELLVERVKRGKGDWLSATLLLGGFNNWQTYIRRR